LRLTGCASAALASCNLAFDPGGGAFLLYAGHGPGSGRGRPSRAGPLATSLLKLLA